MKSTLVKICGITNAEDARWAANLGADFVGLNFCKESPRKVSIEKAREIIKGLPPFVKSVAVFVDSTLDELKKTAEKTKVSVLQLHGNESPLFLQEVRESLNCEIWKAIRMENENSLELISDYLGYADAILLDAFHSERMGGTGESFDWELALKAKELGLPIFLAGGLNPNNVVDAIKKVSPAGVDVASGVEKDGHPRKKDTEKMKDFIYKAKGAVSGKW